MGRVGEFNHIAEFPIRLHGGMDSAAVERSGAANQALGVGKRLIYALSI